MKQLKQRRKGLQEKLIKPQEDLHYQVVGSGATTTVLTDVFSSWNEIAFFSVGLRTVIPPALKSSCEITHILGNQCWAVLFIVLLNKATQPENNPK